MGPMGPMGPRGPRGPMGPFGNSLSGIQNLGLSGIQNSNATAEFSSTFIRFFGQRTRAMYMAVAQNWDLFGLYSFYPKRLPKPRHLDGK